MSESISVQIGPGFVGLLQIVLITLKLLNKISWSWLWVLSPLWIGLSLSLLILLITWLIWYQPWKGSKLF